MLIESFTSRLKLGFYHNLTTKYKMRYLYNWVLWKNRDTINTDTQLTIAKSFLIQVPILAQSYNNGDLFIRNFPGNPVGQSVAAYHYVLSTAGGDFLISASTKLYYLLIYGRSGFFYFLDRCFIDKM